MSSRHAPMFVRTRKTTSFGARVFCSRQNEPNAQNIAIRSQLLSEEGISLLVHGEIEEGESVLVGLKLSRQDEVLEVPGTIIDRTIGGETTFWVTVEFDEPLDWEDFLAVAPETV